MKFVTDDFSLTLLGISAACRRAPPRFFSTACASSVWFFAAGRRKLGSSCADRRPAGTESNFHARSPRLINRPHAAPGFVQSIPRRRAALNPAGTASPPTNYFAIYFRQLLGRAIVAASLFDVVMYEPIRGPDVHGGAKNRTDSQCGSRNRA